MIVDGFYKKHALVAAALPVGHLTIAVEKKPTPDEYSGPYLSHRDDSIEVKGGLVKFACVDDLREFARPFFSGTVFKEVIEHLDWPNDAVFKVSYSTKCWPGGYTNHAVYFTTREEMDEWLADQNKWARLEGNSFQMSEIYEWDFGPIQIA